VPVRRWLVAAWRSEKWGWRAARLLLLVYAGCVLLLVLFESSFLYHPARYVAGDAAAWDVAAAPGGAEGDLVPAIEDVELVAEDGVRLHGWYAAPRRSVRGKPAPVPSDTVLLYLHGNAGNVTHRHETIRGLVTLPAHVFVLDWRGYGKSEGVPSEAGLYRDARAAWRYLTEKRGWRPDRIVLFGESLGGAPAVQLATEVEPAGLVMQAAFTSVPDRARELFPFVPGFLVRNRMDNLSKIRRVRCPTLFLHSRSDEVIPFTHGRRLFEAAPTPKRFYEVPGAGHNDMDRVGGAAYRRVLREFARECATSAG